MADADDPSTGDGGGGDTSDEDATTKRAEQSVSDGLRQEFRAKEPDDERKEALRADHEHHMVRETVSTLSVDPDADGLVGMSVEAEVEVPDTYCFTCEEWVGLSGVDLRGTPRSKEDAHYLGGPPEAMRQVGETVREHLADLVVHARDELPDTTTLDGGAEFVANELETM